MCNAHTQFMLHCKPCENDKVLEIATQLLVAHVRGASRRGHGLAVAAKETTVAVEAARNLFNEAYREKDES